MLTRHPFDQSITRDCSRRRFLGLAAGFALLSTSSQGQQLGLVQVAGTPAAPPLALSGLNGNIVDLAGQKGKVVVINFWASWCAPCRTEFPSLGRLARLFSPSELTVLAVNVGERPEVIASFLKQPGFAIADQPGVFVLLDGDSSAYRNWQIKGLPVTFLVDRQGRLAFQVLGGQDLDDQIVVTHVRHLLRT